MLCLRKNLQKPDRAFQCSPSFFPSACVLAAPLPDAVRALPFLVFSRRHRRSPATSPALPLVATSLSTSAIHPPSPFSLSAHRHHPSSPALPFFSASSPHPTALSPPRHRRLSPPSLPHLHRRLLPPSWSIPLPPPLSLSLFFATLPSPPRRPFVGDLGVRKNLHGFEACRPQPLHLRSSVPYLFSPSASAPSSLIDAAAVASFTAASLSPTKTSRRRRLPSSSTDVVTASLFLHRCPASPPATQESPRPPAPPPLLISASDRCHRRGLEPEMGIS